MSNKRNKKKNIKWYEKPPTEDEKHDFKRALVNFIVDPENAISGTPNANISTYKAVIPYLAQLNPKWRSVDPSHFSTSKHAMFEGFTGTLRNLLTSKVQLAHMLREAREAQAYSVSEEEAEEEQMEGEATPMGDDAEDPKTSQKPTPQKMKTHRGGEISPGSILLKPGEKRPMSALGVEHGEQSFKMQRIEKLEQLYRDLVKKHKEFQDASHAYISCRDSIDFVRPPSFLAKNP